MTARRVLQLRRSPAAIAMTIVVLLAGQDRFVTPLVASEVAGRVVTLSGWAAYAVQEAQRRLPERPIRVNRTVPTVTPPDLRVQFAAVPTVDAIRQARVFAEPLAPVGGEPGEQDTAALARALEQFAAGRGAGRGRVFEAFLVAHPDTPWRASVSAGLASLLWSEGYFSKAAGYWDQAWQLAKDATDPAGRAVADYAIGEWLDKTIMFGNVTAVQEKLQEVGAREVRGPAGNKVNGAREGLAFLTHFHHKAVFSGPEALKAFIDVAGSPNTNARYVVTAFQPASHAGTTMAELQELGRSAGVDLEMRHAPEPDRVPVPAIVHLKSQHFTAVIDREGDAYVLRDPVLGGVMLMSPAALKDEASGYILVGRAPTDQLGRVVATTEASRVLGHCAPGTPADYECPNCGGGGPGLASYTLNTLSASVWIYDTPVLYSPPYGPSVDFTLQYNHRAKHLPVTPTYGNPGALWGHDWLSYVVDNNSSIAAPYTWTDVVLSNGGFEQYNGYAGGVTHWKSRATLVQVSHDPPRYERRLPDASVEVFEYPDRAASLPNRRIFLTERIDPQGHSLTYTYDAQIRLIALTDAIGQVTTLDYEDAAYPLNVTKITDPFGRMAALSYDSLGRLASITDAVGMVSSFSYGGDDFIQSMTTPYGTTAFRRGPDAATVSQFRRIEATDPQGGTERIEFHFGPTSGLTSAAPSEQVPSGYGYYNQSLDYYNSLTWDKRAMAEAPGSLSRATVTHWLMHSDMPYAHLLTRSVPHSIKRPLDRRIWYRYPDQGAQSYQVDGTGSQPSEVAQVLEGGTTQLTQATYNAHGFVTSRTDPLGRQTTYLYDSSGIDLLEMRQVNGGSTDLLARYDDYTSQHLPELFTDAAGQTTTTTYNAAGQVLTVTNSKSETTTSAYDTDGYMHTVTGPVSGSTTTYGYDALGRVSSITAPDGYEIALQYDALNRPTRQTYPDGTYEEAVYQRLDITTERDRKGRITRHFYDRMGRRTSTRDPQGRVVGLVWCTCGVLDELVDGNGNRTAWERDWQNRVVREIRADSTTDTLYTYDATGRLNTVTDPKNQSTTHVYAADDSLVSTTYSNTTIATPAVSYIYDAVYPRVTTMVDGTGTTSYTYKAVGVLGAGQVSSVDGPLADDLITYTFDELGRTTVRAIHGGSNTTTWSYDALGRITSEENLLGTFTYTYDGVTGRLAHVSYPNGQTTTYSYLTAGGDNRLQTIHHKHAGGATLSKFDYSHDSVGNVVTWRQERNATAVLWRYGYDDANHLTSALKESTGQSPSTLQRLAYGYDRAGNRLFEQVDDQVVAASHDALNRLLTHTPGGPLQFVGSVNEPATVRIDGQPAVVDASNVFRGTGVTAAGTTTVTVTATDPATNTATQQFEVDVSGTAKTFTYDANGNMTSDGTRTFEWDARDQLVAINHGTLRSEFKYDGLRQRVGTIEKQAGVVTSTHESVWCDGRLCETRTSGLVVRRPFVLGEQQQGSISRFLSHDHAGSVREVTDASSALVSRYDYGPWGDRTLQGGTDSVATGFTGHDTHMVSGLTLTQHRLLDTSIGRWLSEDPLGLSGGYNLYDYVGNRPLSLYDPLGLQCREIARVPLGTFRRLISTWA